MIRYTLISFALLLYGIIGYTNDLKKETPALYDASLRVNSCGSQEEILTALYHATDGDNWNNNDGILNLNPVGQPDPRIAEITVRHLLDEPHTIGGGI